MAITAKDVLHRVRITLMDPASVRFPLPELLLHLNDGLREIALFKPVAFAKTVEIALAAGTYQTHNHLHLIRVLRNVTSAPGATPRVGGAVITPVERHILDATMPGWQDETMLPHTKSVDHVSQELTDQHAFWVIPGNDGNGLIEAIVSDLPDDIPEPQNNPDQLDSYAMPLPVDDLYRSALVDFVLSRAYTKDGADPANAQRAVAHYQSFANAIGLKSAGEAQANVDTTNSG